MLIWLIHFAPFNCKATLHLEDWQEIIWEAKKLGVSCTLCGHTHQQTKIEDDGHVVYCSGSAGSVEPVGESRIHVIEMDLDDRSVKRTNYRYSTSDQQFRYFSND
jgi:predicted phosphodiesterase